MLMPKYGLTGSDQISSYCASIPIVLGYFHSRHLLIDIRLLVSSKEETWEIHQYRDFIVIVSQPLNQPHVIDMNIFIFVMTICCQMISRCRGQHRLVVSGIE